MILDGGTLSVLPAYHNIRDRRQVVRISAVGVDKRRHHGDHDAQYQQPVTARRRLAERHSEICRRTVLNWSEIFWKSRTAADYRL